MGGLYGFGSFQKLSFLIDSKFIFLIDPNCYLKGGVADRPINRLIGEPPPDDDYIWASVFLGSVGPHWVGGKRDCFHSHGNNRAQKFQGPGRDKRSEMTVYRAR